MSKITIHGNLTDAPDLRFAEGSGNAWATFQVAENHRVKSDGKWADAPTEFHHVKVFGSLAENIAESLHKGDRVVVTGETATREFTPKGANEKVTVVDIVADMVGASLQWATVTITRNAKAAVEPDVNDEADVPPAKTKK